MKIRSVLTAAVLSAACALPLAAQQKPAGPPPSVTSGSTQAKSLPIEQILPLTVHEAWVMSNKDESAFFDIVEQLAQFSAQKRNLSLPDSEAAGRRMGAMIKMKAKADHDQLLYAVVDSAVRAVAKSSTTTASK